MMHYLTYLTKFLICLAKEAIQNLMMRNKSQTILLTGESGSGKTESSRHLVKFLCHSNHDLDEATQIKERITNVNIVLDFFGNSKMLYNDNSSRFSKLTKVKSF